MRFTTKTEYGLVCLVNMARQPQDAIKTVRDLVKSEHYSIAFTEKIFQKLRQAHIVTSHQGKQGGYSLARPAPEITLKEIIEALEGKTFEVFCEPEVREHIVCTHFELCGIKPVWKKTKELLDHYYESITLEMLAHGDLDPAPLFSKTG